MEPKCNVSDFESVAVIGGNNGTWGSPLDAYQKSLNKLNHLKPLDPWPLHPSRSPLGASRLHFSAFSHRFRVLFQILLTIFSLESLKTKYLTAVPYRAFFFEQSNATPPTEAQPPYTIRVYSSALLSNMQTLPFSYELLYSLFRVCKLF